MPFKFNHKTICSFNAKSNILLILKRQFYFSNFSKNLYIKRKPHHSSLISFFVHISDNCKIIVLFSETCIEPHIKSHALAYSIHFGDPYVGLLRK